MLFPVKVVCVSGSDDLSPSVAFWLSDLPIVSRCVRGKQRLHAALFLTLWPALAGPVDHFGDRSLGGSFIPAWIREVPDPLYQDWGLGQWPWIQARPSPDSRTVPG